MATDANNNSLQSGIFEFPESIKDPWTLKDFEMGRKIGAGRFGRVYVVRERRTKYKFIVALKVGSPSPALLQLETASIDDSSRLLSVKVISKKVIMEAENEKNIGNEINIHTTLQHANIVQYFGWFHDDEHVYMVMEYAKTSLFDLMVKKNHVLSNDEAAKVACQTACGMAYLHSKSIIHRDIKPENILIDVQNNVKICDFGWAKFLDKENVDFGPNQSIAGTPDYLPPEMITKKGYDQSVDCWCFGILCYEMVAHTTPFDAPTETEAFRKIIVGVFTYPPDLVISENAKDLINKLLLLEPKTRLNFEQVLKHPWIVPHRP